MKGKYIIIFVAILISLSVLFLISSKLSKNEPQPEEHLKPEGLVLNKLWVTISSSSDWQVLSFQNNPCFGEITSIKGCPSSSVWFGDSKEYSPYFLMGLHVEPNAQVWTEVEVLLDLRSSKNINLILYKGFEGTTQIVFNLAILNGTTYSKGEFLFPIVEKSLGNIQLNPTYYTIELPSFD